MGILKLFPYTKINMYFKAKLSYIIETIKKKFINKEELPARNKKVDIETLRNRLEGLGWKLQELPIKTKTADGKRTVIRLWKVIAHKGDRSFEITGKTLLAALTSLGIMLGVIPQDQT